MSRVRQLQVSAAFVCKMLREGVEKCSPEEPAPKDLRIWTASYDYQRDVVTLYVTSEEFVEHDGPLEQAPTWTPFFQRA